MARTPNVRKFRSHFVTDAGGKGRHKLCLIEDGITKARAELKKWIAKCAEESREAKRANLAQTDKPCTVAIIAAMYLESSEHRKKNTTLKYYRKNLVRLVNWLGKLPVAKLRPIDGDEYVRMLKDDGLSNCTVNHHLNTAKIVLNYAVDSRLLPQNPWKKIKNLPADGRHRVVTDSEFKALLAACDKSIAYQGKVTKENNCQLMRDILLLLRFTALRPGELRILRWDHIDWINGYIVIPPHEHKTGSTSKVPQSRSVPILDEAMPILERRKAVSNSNDLVFPNIVGGQWTDVGLSRRFGQLRKRANLDQPDSNGEYITLYSLRHTRLTEVALHEKWSYPAVQMYAGHAPGSQVTARYVQVNRDYVKQEAVRGQEVRKNKHSALSADQSTYQSDYCI